MTVQDLSKIIRELISSRMERVELPGFGSFVVVETHSEFVNDGMAITPPCTKIVFESSFDNNDTLFAEKYAKLKSISVASAKNEVASFLSSLKRELVEHTELVIPQFGTICFGESGSFVFQPEPAFDFEADSYCLEIIPLKLRGAVETAAVDIELVEEAVEEAEEAGEEAVEAAEEAGEEASEAAQEEVEEAVEAAEEVGEEASEAAQEAVEEAVEEAAEVVGEAVEEIADVPVGEVVAAVVPKKNWVLWGVLTAVGAIILLVVLLFVFKEQLMPLLEQLLYSKEELEILHQAGF